MKEQAYQSRIIKEIEAIGGHVVNGNYTKAGEADLQCGIPVEYCPAGDSHVPETILVHCAVEVKTQYDYGRVMECVDEDYNIIKTAGLKKHEVLQITKLRMLRNKGGLALVAYNFKQIMDYVHGRFDTA